MTIVGITDYRQNWTTMCFVALIHYLCLRGEGKNVSGPVNDAHSLSANLFSCPTSVY